MRVRILVVTAAAIGAGVAGADFVCYFLSSSSGKFVLLEGEVDTRNNAKLFTLRHKKYGEVILPREECKWYKAPDITKKRKSAIQSAAKKKDYEELWRLAKDSIRHGNAGNYFAAARIIAEQDPDHKEAARALRLAAIIDTEIPESKSEETKMKKNAEIERDMKFDRSEHFLLMHDLTNPKRMTPGKATRTQERLEVMEKVYKAYFAFFWSRDYELPPPKERLHVVLLEKERDFKDFASADRGGGLVTASGFYQRIRNVSYFYEHRGTNEFMELKEAASKLVTLGKKASSWASNSGDIVRLGKAVELMNEIFSEQSDVTVCSHEMVHQLAGNTGLMPFHPHIPTWVAEGFACYFESPRDAQWSGIGAVNEERLDFYRHARSRGNKYARIDQVVSDLVFDDAKTHEEKLNAYALSWALTHFLMERHFDKLMSYYKLLTKEPATTKKMLSPKENAEIFFSCFKGIDEQTLDRQWHQYMASLKTDFEELTNMRLSSRAD
jgi:hypothetical protein